MMRARYILGDTAAPQVTQCQQALSASHALLRIMQQQLEFRRIIASRLHGALAVSAWRATVKSVDCEHSFMKGFIMRVAKDKVVSIDYTLTDSQGAVIDSSGGQQPLAYIHGMGNIIPGLEAALEGKSTGENVKAVIPPDQAYGPRNESLVQPLSRDLFDTDEDIVEGMRFQAMSEAGPRVVTVVNVDDDQVTIDGNHPLAGMTLHFDVTIAEVRDASEEELSHGHAHGPGGHDH